MHFRNLFHHCAPTSVCHPRGHRGWHGGRGHSWGGPADDMDEGTFGVRRPLRFLAHKLDLDDRQIAEVARILDALKTERAQAEVDRLRTVSALADALTGDAFNTVRAGEGGDLRVKSAERLRDAVLKALQEIHGVLNGEQRGHLAHMIRTGALAV